MWMVGGTLYRSSVKRENIPRNWNKQTEFACSMFGYHLQPE